MAINLLRKLVAERHWAYSAFVAAFEQAARELAELRHEPGLARVSVSESSYERWLSGRARPNRDARRVLEHMFTLRIEDLLGPVPDGLAGARSGPSVHSEVAMSDTRLPHGETLLDMRGMAAMAANRALRWAITAESAQLGEETMGYLTDEVHRLAESYPLVPLNTILSDLVEAQDLAFRLLESGRAKPTQARDLYLVAAMTAGMLAKSSHDLGDPAAAMRQARTAYICAEQADHNPMRGWVRGLQSLISYWAGRPGDALHFARRGAADAPAPGGTVGVWLASLEARAHALVGDAGGVEAAVRRAEGIRDDVAPDDLDTIGGLLTFGHARQLYYGAEAKVLLPGADDAGQAAQGAVAAYEAAPDSERAFSDEAGARTVLALARIGAGALDGVEEAISPVLDLPVEQRPAGVAISASRVHQALSSGPHRSAAPARQLRSQLEQFTATSPTPALPS